MDKDMYVYSPETAVPEERREHDGVGAVFAMFLTCISHVFDV